MVRYRYSRCDGSQKVFALDADGKPMGIESLLKRLREKRHDALKQFNPDSAVSDIGERLNVIERLEREGIARRVQEVRARLQAFRAARRSAMATNRASWR